MAVATADIHIKVDPRVKLEAERNLKRYGITMSDLINVTLRGFNRERRMPYDVLLDDPALPEDLRIENKVQLVRLLQQAIDEDDGTYYTIEQIENQIERGELRVPA